MEPVPLESSPVAPGADATRLAETPDATRLAETLEPPVRLPFPYNTMNPADVPEEVWQRARADRQKTW